MGPTPFTVNLPPDLVAGLHALAAERDETPGALLREMLARELRRARTAKTPNRADEPLVARLQRLLAAEMASATGWADIEARLRARGFSLRPAGGGLCVHRDGDGARLCKSSELGFPYARLVRKFGMPMPGHPHRMAHLLTKRAAVPAHDGPFDLFEPF